MKQWGTARRGLRAALTLVLSSLLIVGCTSPPTPVVFDGMEQTRYTKHVFKNNQEKLYSANYIDAVGGYRPGSEAKITFFSAERIDLLVNRVPHSMFPAQGEFDTSSPQRFLDKHFVSAPEVLGIDAKGNVVEAAPPAAGETAGDAAGHEGAAAEEPVVEYDSEDHVEAVHAFRLDLMDGATRESVMKGIAAVGMTKHEVYVALGPPMLINFDQPATNLPLDVILDANRWVYYGHWAQRSFSFGLGGKRVFHFVDGKLTHVEK